MLLFSRWVVSNSLQSYEQQRFRLPCPSLFSGICSDSCPLSQWCYLTISSSVVPFSSCPQSFPSSGLFPMSLLFASGGQSTGASASASVLPMNIQGWFPLGLTGLISLLSKGLSRVFSSTTSYCVLFLDEFQTCYHFSSNFLIAWLSSTWIAITSLGRLLTFCYTSVNMINSNLNNPLHL